MTDRPNGLTYAEAGVDIDAGAALVEAIKPLAKATRRPGADAALGGFGALFDLKAAGFDDPLIVSTTDGVGTKLKIAIETGLHDTVGHRPGGHVRQRPAGPGRRAPDVPGLLRHRQAGGGRRRGAWSPASPRAAARPARALVGGETAEMPGMYGEGDYDLAGFCARRGGARRGAAAAGRRRSAGDLLIGLGSSGPHSNGYSLVRRIVERSGLAWDAPAPFAPGQTLAEALMAPTRIYVQAVLPLIKAGLIKGGAHITGGGLIENPPRAIAEGLVARFDWDAWPLPPVFDWLQGIGGVADHELRRTFNCGVGFVLIVAPEQRRGGAGRPARRRREGLRLRRAGARAARSDAHAQARRRIPDAAPVRPMRRRAYRIEGPLLAAGRICAETRSSHPAVATDHHRRGHGGREVRQVGAVRSRSVWPRSAG